jgi:hypothetical protein
LLYPSELQAHCGSGDLSSVEAITAIILGLLPSFQSIATYALGARTAEKREGVQESVSLREEPAISGLGAHRLRHVSDCWNLAFHLLHRLVLSSRDVALHALQQLLG